MDLLDPLCTVNSVCKIVNEVRPTYSTYRIQFTHVKSHYEAKPQLIHIYNASSYFYLLVVHRKNVK